MHISMLSTIHHNSRFRDYYNQPGRLEHSVRNRIPKLLRWL